MIRLSRRGNPRIGAPVAAAELLQLAEYALDRMSLTGPDLDLVLVDDLAQEALNLRHLGLPGPTNVLAFPAESEDGLGLIALNLDAVEREALHYGQEIAEHAARLLLHGLLHLAGYEHGPDMDQALESLLVERPAPYGLSLDRQKTAA